MINITDGTSSMMPNGIFSSNGICSSRRDCLASASLSFTHRISSIEEIIGIIIFNEPCAEARRIALSCVRNSVWYSS